MLYVPVGAPCNICDRGDPYNTIWRMKPDGSGIEIFARGVRNTVGFDWHPTTRELWFTDNGRDNLGDDTPGDELNRAPKAGMHFGYPFCHEGTIVDPEFGAKRPVQRVRAAGAAPRRRTPAQSACASIRARSFPQQYRNQIFIAEHGSWNRSRRHSVQRQSDASVARCEGNKVVSYEPFAEGWLDGRNRWGRPSIWK